MSKSELEKEWLFGNSVVALVGALLWGTAWRPWSGEYTYPIINVSIPNYTNEVFVLIGAFLFLAAFFFGVASLFPLCRNQASTLAICCSPVLKLFTLVGFIISWASTAAKLPLDQWWSEPLVLGSVIFLPIILINMFQDFHRWSGRGSFDSSRSAEAETPGEERCSGGLLLGGIVIAALILISVSRPALLRLWQRVSSG